LDGECERLIRLCKRLNHALYMWVWCDQIGLRRLLLSYFKIRGLEPDVATMKEAEMVISYVYLQVYDVHICSRESNLTNERL
jgi:hypothetical protein